MSQTATANCVKDWVLHIMEASTHPEKYLEWEMLLCSESDELRWYQVFARVKHNLVLFVARDISERKMKQEREKMQKELLERVVQEKTKDLQDALVVKTRFLGFMSHGK